MRRLYGRTALIVNAGASLSAQRPEIAALQDRDDLAIYVTNSASDAVKGHVRVCMESLPPVLADDHSVPLAVDATVHNSTFTRPEVEFVFFKAEGPYSKMAERSNARSLAFGTSVTTAAVAMAAAAAANRQTDDLIIEASGGRVDIDLPAAPTIGGGVISITQSSGSINDWFPVTLRPNGSDEIMGVNDIMVIDSRWASVRVMWSPLEGWVFASF